VYVKVAHVELNVRGGRLTGLVTFCVETAFYNGILKDTRGDRSDRKTRKKT
jgi:hypothetical protein